MPVSANQYLKLYQIIK